MLDTKAWFTTEPCSCQGCEALRQRRIERQLSRWLEIASTPAAPAEITSFEDVADLIQSAIS